MPRLPRKLSATTPMANSINEIIDYMASLTPRASSTSRVSHTPLGVLHTANLPKTANGGGGGYMGNYDNSKSYSSGQTVRVVTPTTIGGVSVAAGLYGVPPGVSVPASGTGNQIPQYPEPTSGTVYWHALVTYCQ